MRKSIRTISFAIALIVVLAIAGVILPRPLWSNPTQAVGNHRILILSNPIHTDIALAVDDDLKARFGFIRAANLDLDLDGVRYLVFGWGGRAFYTETPTWADLKAIPLFKGLTLDDSVMHVEMAGDISDDSPYATPVNLDQSGYERLVSAIRQSFLDRAGNPVLVKGYAYGPYDAFFEANGYFNAVAGCNTWTASMLRQGGVTTGWWTPLPWMLRLALGMHNASRVVGS